MPVLRRRLYNNIDSNVTYVEENDVNYIEGDDENNSEDEEEVITYKDTRDDVLHNFLIECWNISKIYLFWVVIHMFSVNIYCYFCAHLSLYGLFISPFVVVAPHCKALSWLMTNSITSINNMWLTLGTWLVTRITINTNN